MSRLILPQFKEVVGGVEVDRSLDKDDVDAALAKVAKVLNGGITEENFAPSLRFSIGATAGTVQNAWEKTRSIVTLVGQSAIPDADLAGGVTAMVLGGTGVSAWTPVSITGLLLSDANAPVVTFYYGSTALTVATTSTAVDVTSLYRVTSAKTAYEFSITAFLAAPVPAGSLVRMTSTRAIYGVSTVTATFTADHL